MTELKDLKRYSTYEIIEAGVHTMFHLCSDVEAIMPKWVSVVDQPIPEEQDLLFGHYNEVDKSWIWIASGCLEAGEYWLDWKDDTFVPTYMHSITHYMSLLPIPDVEVCDD